MLKIEKLKFSYPGDPSFKMEFNLEVAPGEILSLIGPSGSGKSSLLNLIAGFLTSSSGSIFVDQKDISQLAISQRPISMVFQQHNLFPHLDVYTNLALGLSPSLKITLEQKAALHQVLEKIGLSGMQLRKPGELSGGQQQRVALGRALLRDRCILLLDEPFTALGPALREELVELVKSLVERNSLIAIMVSHQPKDALLASKRCAFLDQGEILCIDKTKALLSDSKLHQVRQYLGNI